MKVATKATKRKTMATVFSAGRRRQVIVTVYPEGIIGLRLLRERTEEFIDAAHAYRMAALQRAARAAADKRKARKAAKGMS